MERVVSLSGMMDRASSRSEPAETPGRPKRQRSPSVSDPPRKLAHEVASDSPRNLVRAGARPLPIRTDSSGSDGSFVVPKRSDSSDAPKCSDSSEWSLHRFGLVPPPIRVGSSSFNLAVSAAPQLRGASSFQNLVAPEGVPPPIHVAQSFSGGLSDFDMDGSTRPPSSGSRNLRSTRSLTREISEIVPRLYVGSAIASQSSAMLCATCGPNPRHCGPPPSPQPHPAPDQHRLNRAPTQPAP